MNKSILKLLEEKDKFKSLAKEYKECLQSIHNKIYNIGGPLNDNVLKFNKKQMKLFWNIAKEIEYLID